MRNLLGTTTAALLVAAGLGPATPSAMASPSAASAGGCPVAVGSVTAGGDHKEQGAFAATPPTASAGLILGRGVYPDGAVRISSSMSRGDDGISIVFVSGYSVLGDALYLANYSAGDDAVIDGGVTRIGGG